MVLKLMIDMGSGFASQTYDMIYVCYSPQKIFDDKVGKT